MDAAVAVESEIQAMRVPQAMSRKQQLEQVSCTGSQAWLLKSRQCIWHDQGCRDHRIISLSVSSCVMASRSLLSQMTAL